jgi:hypothetical protein
MGRTLGVFKTYLVPFFSLPLPPSGAPVSALSSALSAESLETSAVTSTGSPFAALRVRMMLPWAAMAATSSGWVDMAAVKCLAKGTRRGRARTLSMRSARTEGARAVSLLSASDDHLDTGCTSSPAPLPAPEHPPSPPPAMAPRMNAAAPPSRPAKAAPSPTTATKTAALPPAQETKSAAWWARRLFRVGSLVFAAYFMYPRLFPSNEMVVSREVLGKGGYEPIVVDVEKRAAILDAFKVSTS